MKIGLNRTIGDIMVGMVLGGAACVWNDLILARKLFTPSITAVVNDIGTVYPHHIDCWVSYHPANFSKWLEQRQSNGLPGPDELWTYSEKAASGKMKICKCTGGSSGLLATMVLLEKCIDRIVLVGVPMDPAMLNWNPKRKSIPWVDGVNYLEHWLKEREKLMGKVKSMSGWTAEVFGQPSKEWLER